MSVIAALRGETCDAAIVLTGIELDTAETEFLTEKTLMGIMETV